MRRPLIVGEVLFDVKPDGGRVLGGAPFNVAWHLQALGLRPLIITRVGGDDLGDEVLAAMEGWGMDTSGVQRDDAHPTGQVQVELNQGEPSYNILGDQAYDHLDFGRAMHAMGGETFCLLYHGSLISRGKASRAALVGLKVGTGIPAFIDVNLRTPWWTREDVLASIRRATIVKLNAVELEVLARGSDLAAANALRIDLGLDTVIVTSGSLGAAVLGSGGTVETAAPAGIRVIDTVGAGDAFSALFILGLVKGWPPARTLERAVEFAAAVCAMRGATTTDRRLYRDVIDELIRPAD